MNKKNLLTDFYMYEFICNYRQLTDSKDDLNLKYEAIEFLHKFKNELIEILEYVIIAESSHIWWELSPTFKSNSTDMFLKTLSDDVSCILYDFQSEWRSTLQNLETDGVLQGVERGWALQRVISSNYPIHSFIYDIRKIWKLHWNPNFGGPIWEQITNVYFKLRETTELDLFIVIDTILDLEHNTNTIFNKIPKYKIDDSYEWIKQFLNLKSNLKDPWILYNDTYDSKKIAAKKLKEFELGTLSISLYENNVSTSLSNNIDLSQYITCSDINSIHTDFERNIKNLLHEHINKNNVNTINAFDDLKISLNSHIDELFRILRKQSDDTQKLISDNQKTLCDNQRLHEIQLLELNNASEHLVSHVNSNRVHIEKYIKNIHFDMLSRYNKSQSDLNMKLIKIEEQLKLLNTPWYTKFINTLKKMFGVVNEKS